MLLPSAAFAQGAPASADCDRLITVLEQQKPANAPVTLDQARAYKRDNNARGCQEALNHAGMPSQGSAAQITVQQSTPHVVVQQAQPSVTVSQPQPEITVHQPAPTVTVEIPQPVITITMPKPQVNVAMAQPQVQVSQAQPQVQVVPSAQPQVNVQASGQQPNVTVQDGQQPPKINYTSDQAKVVVNQPKGAPTVHVQQAGQGANTTGQPNAAVAAASAQGSPQAGTQAVNASKLMKMDVVNAHGDTLGDVEHVLMHTADKKSYVVIGHGGFLGMGEKQVALPVDNMFLRNGKLVMRGITDDQIKAMPSWTQGTQGFTDFTADQPVHVSTSG